MPYALCLMPDTATPIGGGAGAGAEGGAADVQLQGPGRGGGGACALRAPRLLGAGNAPDALCLMPYALCLMPYAVWVKLCSRVLCALGAGNAPDAVCRMPYALCLGEAVLSELRCGSFFFL